jgi:hypothetical protein
VKNTVQHGVSVALIPSAMNGSQRMGKSIILTPSDRKTLVSDEDFHWLSQRNWYLAATGYACCDLWGRRGGMKVLMHRLILMAPDTATVDHINGDPLDNRRENLRLATQAQQNANRHRIKGRSQFKGVYRRRDGLKWCAQIRKDRMIYLGSFISELEAAMAYNAAAAKLFGEFAVLNPIPENYPLANGGGK